MSTAVPNKTTTAPTTFTWSKGRDGDWLARGPRGKSGCEVSIVRKDGSSQSKVLGVVVWEDDVVALYRVLDNGTRRPSRDSSQSSRSTGAGRSDVCAECGRPGALVRDLEDGQLKHRYCCDIDC